jgi:hypothetical protein
MPAVDSPADNGLLARTFLHFSLLSFRQQSEWTSRFTILISTRRGLTRDSSPNWPQRHCHRFAQNDSARRCKTSYR